MKGKLGKILLPLLVVVILIGIFGGVYVVNENEYACVVRFEKIVATTQEAGLHLKVPFLESVKFFPKAIMFYDIPPSEVLTSDKQNMTVDSYVLWRIQDPLLFYQTLGGTAAAEQRLDALPTTP